MDCYPPEAMMFQKNIHCFLWDEQMIKSTQSLLPSGALRAFLGKTVTLGNR